MMFTVEILYGGNWEVASNHTLEIDALAQVQRFKDEGIDEANIRIKKGD